MSIATRLSSSIGTNDPMNARSHARGEPSRLGHPGAKPHDRPLGDVALRREQQFVLGAEVVLHESHRHARLGRDLAECRGGEPALQRDADDGVGDLAPPLSMIHSLRHRLS